jgi:hypothetical protein
MMGEGQYPMLCSGPVPEAEGPPHPGASAVASMAVIRCNDDIGHTKFSMSTITMAFQETFDGGFIFNSREYPDTDTPNITLGHCAVLNE